MIKDIISFLKKRWPQILACLLIAASVLMFMVYAHYHEANSHFGGPGLSWTCASFFLIGLGILYFFRPRKE
jgi:hypothetical protein